jgi:hypothetical protein
MKKLSSLLLMATLVLSACNFDNNKPSAYHDNATREDTLTGGVKLIPIFFNKLADAFLRTNNYDEVIDIICKQQGTLSDNGDKWVDKYSGYIIKNILFDLEEVYDSK